jgi:hypothetical protein
MWVVAPSGVYQPMTREIRRDTDHFNTTLTGAEFFFTHCHD